MSDIERHEDEGARAFDPHLARRLLRYLAPYRLRASVSVGLVILSSLLEIAGPAIVAIAIDLYVKPAQGAHVAGVSQRIGEWLVAHGWALDPLSGINLAAAFYFLVLFGGELPAPHKLQAEGGQEVGRGMQAGDLLGFAGALGQREAVAGRHAEVSKDIGARPVGFELGP